MRVWINNNNSNKISKVWINDNNNNILKVWINNNNNNDILRIKLMIIIIIRFWEFGLMMIIIIYRCWKCELIMMIIMRFGLMIIINNNE